MARKLEAADNKVSYHLAESFNKKEIDVLKDYGFKRIESNRYINKLDIEVFKVLDVNTQTMLNIKTLEIKVSRPKLKTTYLYYQPSCKKLTKFNWVDLRRFLKMMYI